MTMLHYVMPKTTERVHFRFLQAPCCSALLCWVNPRLPNYCPECGTHIFPAIRSCVLNSDDSAFLKVDHSAFVADFQMVEQAQINRRNFIASQGIKRSLADVEVQDEEKLQATISGIKEEIASDKPE